MGLALTNPNDRRRINAAARAVVKSGASISDVVGMITSGKSASQIKKAYDIYSPKGQKGARVAAAIAAGPQSKATKQKYANAKSAIAMGMQKAGYGKPSKQGFAKPVGYAKRALGGKAKRYYLKRKKNDRYKANAFGRQPYSTVDVAAVREFNKRRVERRAAGVTHQQAWAEQKASWKSAPKRKSSGRGGDSMAAMAMRIKKERGVSLKEAWDIVKGREDALTMVSNPRVFGGLALTNPDYRDLAMKAGVATIGAAAGAYVHAKAVPWVSENVYARIPVAGEYLQEYAYASTGLLAGAILGGAAAAVGGQAGLYLGLLAGGVAAAGGALQVAEMTGMLGEGDLDLNEDALDEEISDDMAGVFGGIALDNQGVFGGIALDNQGVFGGIALDNYGDGMAYEIGGFSSPFDDAASAYGSAELADAQHAGADLDVAEGQAACAGPQEWTNRFGHPPHRVNAMGGSPGAPSHLAGRRGHRWGWLIKLIGFKKFQRLAALPPKQRLTLIKKMRSAAIITMQRELKPQLPAPSPEFVSGHTANMAETANGADSSYAGMLFAGQAAM
jgi:hypothetical protein